MTRWFRRIRGQYKLMKASLYLYRQGKPWDFENGFTQCQHELLEAAGILLNLKDNY